MLLLGKTRKNHTGDLPPTVADLPPPPRYIEQTGVLREYVTLLDTLR